MSACYYGDEAQCLMSCCEGFPHQILLSNHKRLRPARCCFIVTPEEMRSGNLGRRGRGRKCICTQKCVCVCVTMSLSPSVDVFHPLHSESDSRPWWCANLSRPTVESTLNSPSAETQTRLKIRSLFGCCYPALKTFTDVLTGLKQF